MIPLGVSFFGRCEKILRPSLAHFPQIPYFLLFFNGFVVELSLYLYHQVPPNIAEPIESLRHPSN